MPASVYREAAQRPGSCIAAVIPAGGTGTRMNAPLPKQFLVLAGKPVLVRTIERVLELEDVSRVVVALPAGHLAAANELFRCHKTRLPIQCIAGGANRQESVRRGVIAAGLECEILLVHDAVRPLCGRDMMNRVVQAALDRGAAVPGLPANETIQRVSRSGRILRTPPREELFAIQTPQCFKAEILRSALERAHREGFLGTDESSVVRWAGHPVYVVEGSPTNLKITRPTDLKLAELLWEETSGGKDLSRRNRGERVRRSRQ